MTHNRFLILQGEVESIAQMKPKGATDHEEGLLEYLEDIIGTNRYKKLIEEAAVDVERLGDERQVQMNRVKLVEKEKGALEVRLDLVHRVEYARLTVRLFASSFYRPGKRRPTPTSAISSSSSDCRTNCTNGMRTKPVPIDSCTRSRPPRRKRNSMPSLSGKRLTGSDTRPILPSMRARSSISRCVGTERILDHHVSVSEGCTR